MSARIALAAAICLLVLQGCRFGTEDPTADNGRYQGYPVEGGSAFWRLDTRTGALSHCTVPTGKSDFTPCTSETYVMPPDAPKLTKGADGIWRIETQSERLKWLKEKYGLE
jgi:hypothetical protein